VENELQYKFLEFLASVSVSGLVVQSLEISGREEQLQKLLLEFGPG